MDLTAVIAERLAEESAIFLLRHNQLVAPRIRHNIGVPLTRKPSNSAVPSPWDLRNLGTLRLYLDDVQDVLDHLARRGGEPMLFAGTSVADAASDLKDATRQELGEVKITAFNGDLILTLTRRWAQATWRKTNAVAQQAAHECAALLSERRLPSPLAFAQVWGALTLWFGGSFGAMVALAVLINAIWGDGVMEWSGFWVAGLMALLTPLAFALLTLVDPYSRTSRTRIYPLLRREGRELSVTRRTAWTVGLVTAVCSAAAGAALTVWLSTLT